jgi:hypothetical protein
MWGFDAVGPFRIAPGGYKHILVAIDKFTKWIEVRPVAKVTSEEAVKFIRDIKHRVNTKIWYRKESDLWAQLGGKIRPGEGRFLLKDSAKELAVGNLLPFGKGTVCADFAGLRGDVARAEGTNGWISIHIWAIN